MRKSTLIIAGAILASCCGASMSAQAQETPKLGQIVYFLTEYCPANYVLAFGQIVPNTGEYSALAAMMGVPAGQTSFRLPKLYEGGLVVGAKDNNNFVGGPPDYGIIVNNSVAQAKLQEKISLLPCIATHGEFYQ